MNFLLFIAISICYIMILDWFHKNTCITNNHNFVYKNKNIFVCKKCGLIKKAVIK